MYSEDNFYDFLGIPFNANADDIKKAYRKLALKYHPDTGSHKDDLMMKKLNYVYGILSDPSQKASYDDSIRHSGHTRKEHTHKYDEKEKQQSQSRPEPDNYGTAIFVTSIKITDSSNVTEFVERGDYIYYPVKVRKKILFFEYEATDYYRAIVKKVFSENKNSFKKVPSFVISLDGLEQIIFKKDFQSNWLNEAGYIRRERTRAVTALVVGIGIISLLIYKLFTLS